MRTIESEQLERSPKNDQSPKEQARQWLQENSEAIEQHNHRVQARGGTLSERLKRQ